MIKVLPPNIVMKQMDILARTPAEYIITPGIQGVITNQIQVIAVSVSPFSPDDGSMRRKLLLCLLFGKPNARIVPFSSKLLSESQWYALSRWSAPIKADGVGWAFRPSFRYEEAQIILLALDAFAKGLTSGMVVKRLPKLTPIDIDPENEIVKSSFFMGMVSSLPRVE